HALARQRPPQCCRVAAPMSPHETAPAPTGGLVPPNPSSPTSLGLRITRHFAAATPWKVLESVVYARRSTLIKEGDEVVFEMKDYEVPAAWSQRAGDILASKYFRK